MLAGAGVSADASAGGGAADGPRGDGDGPRAWHGGDDGRGRVAGSVCWRGWEALAGEPFVARSELDAAVCLQSASAALRLSAGSAHESAQRARAARAVSLCVMAVAIDLIWSSCLSALSSAWVSADWAQVRSCWRVRPWRAARDGRGRVSARKSWKREGEGEREALGTGHKALGEEEEEELFESPTSVGEEEGGSVGGRRVW